MIGDRALLTIKSCALPPGALLAHYRSQGAYTDCYATDIAAPVSQAQYIAAFYTTPLFRLERLILKWVVSRPSTDAEALQLAAGSADTFAAWQVEQRGDNQLLLSDLYGRTRSWLMAAPVSGGGAARTRLYFGSAVVPRRNVAGAPARIGWIYRALMGFHQLYSQLLLYSAKARLQAQAS